jgi:hypothetical protein
MGEFLRRMKAKLGAEAGITAAAHKIARIFYAVVKNQVEYDDTTWHQQDLANDGSKLRSDARPAVSVLNSRPFNEFLNVVSKASHQPKCQRGRRFLRRTGGVPFGADLNFSATKSSGGKGH